LDEYKQASAALQASVDELHHSTEKVCANFNALSVVIAEKAFVRVRFPRMSGESMPWRRT
jgi:hypothetical protein